MSRSGSGSLEAARLALMTAYGTQLRPRQNQLLAHSRSAALVTNMAGELAGPRDGFFLEACRLISVAILRIDGQQPEAFSAARVGATSILAHGRAQTDRDLLEDALFTQTEWAISGERLRLQLRLTNHAPHRRRAFSLSLELQADFADFQETQEGSRQQCAEVETRWDEAARVLRFDYRHPEIPISTLVALRSASLPLSWSDGRFETKGELGPQEQLTWEFEVSREPARLPGATLAPAKDSIEPPKAPRLRTSNPTVARAWETAVADLRALPLGVDKGPHALAAGVPLYLHFFGRDTLTAGWQALLAGPEYLRDALLLNAELQGTRVDDAFDEQPGRMIHEVRAGPLSLLGKDSLLHNYSDYATPPDFVAMLGQYYAWTADRETTKRLLPAAWRALDWLERDGDLDHDGFLEYVTRSPHGVKNQGWKDAPDSIVDDDGNIAENPLATSELQGYWFAALQIGALLAATVARDYRLALRLRNRARRLREQFNATFWLEDQGHYALALDSRKRPIRAAGSNDAHLLVTGIVPRERAVRMVERLFQPDIFTGWGIRTLSSEHAAYNPFSYHRGSVWPVEHGTFALGLARYGFWDELGRLAKAVFDACELFEEYRLPEVLGGLQRDESGSHPGIYPDACSPQAWTASTIVMLVQSLLGLNPLAPTHTAFLDPHLPAWLPELRLSGVRIGQSTMNIHAWRDRSGSTKYRVSKRGSRLLVLRQPPPQDPSGTLGARLRGLIPHG